MTNQLISPFEPKYNGLYKLVDSFCNNMKNLNKEDIDSYLLFTLLFAYSTKYLKEKNQELTTDTIYNFMERIWEDKTSRQEIIHYYIKNLPKQIQIKNND